MAKKKKRRHKGGPSGKGGGGPAEVKAPEGANVQDSAKAANRAKDRDRAEATDGAKAADGAKATDGAKPSDSGKPSDSALVEWTKSLLVAAVLFVVIRTFILQTFVITSGSMEDALLVGDFLIANRAAVGVRIPGTQIRIPGYSSVRRGDVLVFDPPHEPDLKLVKRLIGVPGDTVSMKDGVLTLNGQLQDEPYVKHRNPAGDSPDSRMVWQAEYLVDGVPSETYRPTRDNWGPLVIPEDRYFMLGDNRDTSLDSRYWGLLEGWRIEGRASFIYFSYNKGSYRPFSGLREIRFGRVFSRIR
jgi:signal peptidase I